MKIEELRVGNWVMGYHDPFQWSLRHFNLLKQADLDEIVKEPVLITEEILLKCGFKVVHPEYKDIYAIRNIEYLVGCGDKSGMHWNGYQLPKTKYLHQLQNAYYAITGEELKINL